MYITELYNIYTEYFKGKVIFPVTELNRQSGKTTFLAQQCIKENGIMIVETPLQLRHVKSLFPNLNILTADKINTVNYNIPIFIDDSCVFEEEDLKNFKRFIYFKFINPKRL